MTFTFSLTQFLIDAFLSHLTLTEPVATSSILRLSSINPQTETLKVISALSTITNETHCTLHRAPTCKQQLAPNKSRITGTAALIEKKLQIFNLT